MSTLTELGGFAAFLQNAVLLASGFIFDFVFSPLSLTILLVWLLLFFVLAQLAIF